MIDAFNGPRLKLERAEKHIEDINAEISAFFASKPYTAVAQVHAHTQPGHIAWTASVKRGIPRHWPSIVGDAVHNLRASLDLAVSEIARSHGNSDKGIQFPTADDKNGLKAAIQSGLDNRTSAQTSRIIETLLEPFPGGRGQWLRTIHLLDIVDKHRLIVPVAYGLTLYSLPQGKGGPIGLGNDFYVPLKDGAVFMDMVNAGRYEIGDEADVAVTIEFDEPVPITKRKVIAALECMASDAKEAVRLLATCV